MPESRQTRPPLPIGVLLSGSGSTLANLIERLADGRLAGIRIACVISSRSAVRGVEIARGAGLPTHVVRRRDFADSVGFSNAIANRLEAAGVELVVMAGFLCYWHVPARYAGRTLNIHPALLPAFGGRGMYGAHVHAAVLRARAAESGCTVHLVDEQYDHGPILAQSRVAVHANDTVDSLAARVGAAERELYPRVLADFAAAWSAAAPPFDAT